MAVKIQSVAGGGVGYGRVCDCICVTDWVCVRVYV